jgi:hypothetical protein
MPSQYLDDIVLTLCEDAGTSRALTVWLLYKHKEYGQLVALTIDPMHYMANQAYAFHRDATVTGLLSKFSGFAIPGLDKPKNAVLAFMEDERTCERTNNRLRPYLHNALQELADSHVIQSLDRMRAEIRSTLGRIPDDLGEARFGPGATFGDRGALTTVPDKITSRPTCTSDAWWLSPLWERTAWARAKWQRPFSGPCIIRGNRFTTVPKDARKDRGIAIEPSINVFFQLGAGSVIRRRLRRLGVDLDHGQSLHRDLAQIGSRKGLYSTIDLSSASDTVCKVLVELLLPPEWFSLLDSLRSRMTFVDGKWHHLSKFSSMGNGFTFELETLIFLSLGREACRLAGVDQNLVRVYGDDIIVPTEAGAVCVSLLKFFGFRPNPKKTFLTGVFRESCGGDFFNGVAVRPHYLKEDPDEPQKIISLANGLRRLGADCPSGGFPYHFAARAHKACVAGLPTHIRALKGPSWLGDQVIDNDDRSQWIRRLDSRGRWWIRCLKPRPVKVQLHHWTSPVVYACALYGVPSDGVTPRGGVLGYSIGWVAGD